MTVSAFASPILCTQMKIFITLSFAAVFLSSSKGVWAINEYTTIGMLCMSVIQGVLLS